MKSATRVTDNLPGARVTSAQICTKMGLLQNAPALDLVRGSPYCSLPNPKIVMRALCVSDTHSATLSAVLTTLSLVQQVNRQRIVRTEAFCEVSF